MPTLTFETWARIRADYEHSETPIEAICAEHGISSGTLRDRMRRWEWVRRRPPIPREGPPPRPMPPRLPVRPFDPAPMDAAAMPAALSATAIPAGPEIAPAPPNLPASPQAVPAELASEPPPPADPALIALRLQRAVARVLPAIEATLGTLAAAGTPPREMERAARALAALTRTLRELNALLAQHPATADDDPSTLDEFRQQLMRRMDAVIAARAERSGDGA